MSLIVWAASEDPNFRNPPAALKHARRAVELTHWKQVASVDTLAEAFYSNRDFRSAVKVEAKALRLEPGNYELQDHMARYCKAAGIAELPRDVEAQPFIEPQSRNHARRGSASPEPADRVPLLWIVPGAGAVLLLLGLFGAPR